MAPSKSKAAHKVTPETGPASKKDRVIALLQHNGGTTLSEITQATGWLPHSARAVLTGLRKKGFTIAKVREAGVTRWSITAEPSA